MCKIHTSADSSAGFDRTRNCSGLNAALKFTRPIFLICVALLTGCTTGVPTVSDQLTESQQLQAGLLASYSEGISFIERGDLADAKTSFSRMLRMDPHNGNAASKLAGCFISSSEIDYGIAQFSHLAELTPDSYPVQRWLALLLQLDGRNQRAEQTYRRAIDLRPQAAEVYIELAIVMIEQGRDSDAVALLEQAQDDVGVNYEMMALRAGIHSRLADEDPGGLDAERHREAAISALEAIPASPDNRLRHELALVHLYLLNEHYDKGFALIAAMLESGDLAGASRSLALRTIIDISRANKEGLIDSIGPLLKTYSNKPMVLEFFADVLAGFNMREDAIEVYRQAVESGQVGSDVYLKGALLELSLDPEKESGMLARGLARFPQSPELLVLEGRLRFEDGDYAGAVNDFDLVYSLIQNDDDKTATPFFIAQYSLAHQLNGDAGRALRIVKESSEIDFAFLQRYFTYAVGILSKDDYPLILDMLNMLAESRPDDPILAMYIGHYHNLMRQYNQAAISFSRSIELMPKDADQSLKALAHFWYGASLERQGKIDSAAEQFKICIKLAPGYAEAYNYLAYMWAAAGLNLDRARELVMRALELEPDNGAYLDTLGWIDYKQGRYGEALANLKRAYAIINDDPSVLDHIGDTHSALGDIETARQYWQRALDIDSGNSAVAAKLKKGKPSPKPAH